MENELFLEPNRKAQVIVLLAIILGALVLASLDPVIHYLTPNQNAPLKELESRAKIMGLLAVGAFSIALIISLMWASYFGRLGYRTLKLGRYPPPDTIVIRRTRVRSGKEAVIPGYLSILFAALMGLFALPIGYAIWLFSQAL